MHPSHVTAEAGLPHSFYDDEERSGCRTRL
jgi:hypothetical protein